MRIDWDLLREQAKTTSQLLDSIATEKGDTEIELALLGILNVIYAMLERNKDLT